MNDSTWARGYPVLEPYPPAWHPFQSPAHLRAACAIQGVAWEAGPETPLSICDIGCGSGYTANVLAAGSPHWQVLGLDYNPAHIAEARSFAAAAGLANARFEEVDLAELDGAALDRLPEFDLVSLHGLWSWVDDRVRDGVLRLLRRKLKPGGIALVTYNALPGAATALGLWKLVRAALLAGGDLQGRIAAARGMVEKLVASEARHLLPSTWRSLLLGEMGQARQGYLLHEFLTEHWRPAFFADVAAAMAGARCEHVGSATLDENFPGMTLSPDQQALWHAAPDAAARELVKDLCVPRAFRRDIFMRGIRRVPRDAACDAITLAADDLRPGPRKLVAQAGEAELPATLLDPMRAALAERPRSVAELRALPGCGGVTPPELVAMLVGSHCAAPLWRMPGSGPGWAEAAAAAQRLNAVAARRLAPHGVGSGGRLALATPALGGGLAVEALELAVASALTQLPPDPDGGVEFGALVHALLPAGAPPPPEALDSLRDQLVPLLGQRLPVWQALGIV
ncbi:class I SAM-dependent methyltransferase [Falsiroseomonas sp. CW058]|uniref:class I SAM-dependent methyltransferase n=1 Tax=Falsiroseomonas sp. CW058 TaxID=3388664 RepID=UPI003D318E01